MHLRFIKHRQRPQGHQADSPRLHRGRRRAAVFTNEFLALLRQLNAGVLRAMDWQRINGSTVSKWSERATRDDPTYSDRAGRAARRLHPDVQRPSAPTSG
jgi:hypothetical protein